MDCADGIHITQYENNKAGETTTTELVENGAKIWTTKHHQGGVMDHQKQTDKIHFLLCIS